jgi:integrase
MRRLTRSATVSAGVIDPRVQLQARGRASIVTPVDLFYPEQLRGLKARIPQGCLAKIDPPIQFRQLRTTYGSLLLNADAPLNTISELLGHRDTRMTRRHYAHLLWDKLKETVDERLPTFIPASNPSSSST